MLINEYTQKQLYDFYVFELEEKLTEGRLLEDVVETFSEDQK